MASNADGEFDGDRTTFAIVQWHIAMEMGVAASPPPFVIVEQHSAQLRLLRYDERSLDETAVPKPLGNETRSEGEQGRSLHPECRNSDDKVSGRGASYTESIPGSFQQVCRPHCGHYY